jgi:hypothetical protein
VIKGSGCSALGGGRTGALTAPQDCRAPLEDLMLRRGSQAPSGPVAAIAASWAAHHVTPILTSRGASSSHGVLRC